MIDNINIEIPSLPENIRIIESFIDNTKDRFKLNDDIYGNIMIAVTEAVNNAIRHGNKCDSDKNVKLNLAFLGTIIKFTVKDQGAGFDHTRLPHGPGEFGKPRRTRNISHQTPERRSGFFRQRTHHRDLVLHHRLKCPFAIFAKLLTKYP